MKIGPDTSIIDDVRNELAELAANVPAQEYMDKAAERIGRWISFIDDIQKQRDALVQLGNSLGNVRAFVSGSCDKPSGTAPSSREEERGAPALPKVIRSIAGQELATRGEWLTTAELGASLALRNALLRDLKSSLISASMEYGRKKGLFGAKFVRNTKYWGLAEWEKDGEKSEGLASRPGS